MEVGRLIVVIGAKMDELEAGLRKAQEAVEQAKDKFEAMRKSGKALTDLGTKVSAVGAALSAAFGFAAKAGIDYNATMEQARISFETMLGSAGKAQEMLQKLWKFAEETPFEFPELQTAAKQMLAFGFSAESIIPTLKAVGDAAAGLGLSGAEGINRIIIALGQMRAKQKVSAEEMMQLTEAGIPAWEILAKAMGKSTQEVMDLASKGLIPANQAIDALVKGMEERFPNMMKKQSETFSGLISTLKDKVATNLGDMIKPFFTLAKGVIQLLLPVLDLFNKLPAPIKGAIGLLFGLAAVGTLAAGGFMLLAGGALKFVSSLATLPKTISTLTQALKGLPAALEALRGLGGAAGVVGNAFSGLTNVFKGVWSVISTGFSVLLGFGPILLVVAAAAAVLAGAAYLIYKNWDKVKKFFADVWQSIKDITVQVGNEILEFFKKWGPLLLATVTGPFGIMIYAIVKHWDEIKKATIAAWDAVKDWLAGVWNGIKERAVAVFQGIRDSVLAVWNNFRERVCSIARAIWEGVTRPFVSLYEKVRDTFQKVVDAIVGPFKRAYEKICEYADKIKTALNKINPFARSSPSLVDRVKAGVDVIQREYAKLSRLELPHPSGMSLGGLSVALAAEAVPAGAVEHRHSGSIRVEGVNSQGKLMDVVNIIVSELRREVRSR